MHTSLQTSERRLAVRSQISLCLIEGNPPFWQERACSTENCVPQSQLTGVRSGCHPYLRHNASRKAPLCNVNPNSVMGRAVSHPFPGPGPWIFGWRRRKLAGVGWQILFPASF